MVSSSQIREQISRLLENEINLAAFEDWFVQSTWNIHQSGSVAAENLTYSIEESLSEYSSLHISDRALRNELLQILHSGSMVFELSEVPAQIIYGASTPAAFLPVTV